MEEADIVLHIVDMKHDCINKLLYRSTSSYRWLRPCHEEGVCTTETKLNNTDEAQFRDNFGYKAEDVAQSFKMKWTYYVTENRFGILAYVWLSSAPYPRNAIRGFPDERVNA